jgi:Rap1a immunity proteins
MKVLLSALVTVLGALVAAAASAEDRAMSAGDLQQLCLGTDTTSRNVCRIYILGVVQGIEVGLNIADGQLARARPCIPDSSSAEALEQAVKGKLDEDLAMTPADRDRDASRIIATAAARAFPCRKP